MKFRVSMKDPDTLIDAIDEAVRKEVESLPGIEPDERDDLVEKRSAKVLDLCGKWFRYSEYLTVEIDTEAKTCTVVPERGS